MKQFIVIALTALALCSCGGSNANKPLDEPAEKKVSMADSIVGDWITVADGETSDAITDTTGVTLKKGGEAQSINMPTYQYKKWKLSGDTIIMSAVSTAEGLPADTTITDSGIVDLKKNTITLYGGDIVYKRKQ